MSYIEEVSRECDNCHRLQRELDAALTKLAAAEANTARLKEAISPGRTANLEYYIGVADRMRAREMIIKPMEVTLCTRDYQHEGPCNGFPRPACVDAARKEGKS